MAHSKSSKKRVFIGERNAARNKSIKSRVKTFVKKVLIAVEAKNVDEAKAALQVAYKELDISTVYDNLFNTNLFKKLPYDNGVVAYYITYD